MAVQLMLVAVHVVRITRPTCIRPESARRFMRAKRLGSPCPLQVRNRRLDIQLHPQQIFCPFSSKTFIEGMTKWRSHAIDSSANLAAYYNLGAFSQSIRMGLTHAYISIPSILCRLNAWLTMPFPLGTWSSILHFP